MILLLAGCTEYRPVHWGGAVPWEQARKAIYRDNGERTRQVPENGRHVVMPGETVSELAVLYRVPSREIIALNSLRPPYHIFVGQVLQLPQPQRDVPRAGPVHVVQRGETLSGIAAARGIRLGDLVALNNHLDPRRLPVGAELRLPAGGTARVASRPAGDRPAQSGTRSPSDATSTIVAGAPAARPATTPATSQAAPTVPPATPAVRPAAPPTDAIELARLAPDAAERDAARQRDLAAVASPARSGEGFLWPVATGTVISLFGAKPDGRRNDGINIATAQGSIVRAAENGVVVYADEDLAAFGRMLLIRHADGYLSAYAHNEALLVTRGDIVSRGQPIAKVGRTGEVVEPQLHFEIRRGKEAVDPLKLLGEGEVRVARRD